MINAEIYNHWYIIVRYQQELLVGSHSLKSNLFWIMKS